MEALQIRDERSQVIPMKFSASQEIFWSYVAPQLDAGERGWFICLKARQVYSTTFFTNLVFVRTSERPNTHSLIIAHELPSSADIFDKAKRFYEHLPLPKLKPSKVKEIEFAFPEGSSYLRVASAGTVGKGRGMNLNCVMASEVAFWPRSEVLVGLFQAVPNLPDTFWILESTANGMSGVGKAFFDEWRAAVDGRSSLTPIFIPWFVMPKYRMTPALDPQDWDDDEKLLVQQFGQYGVDGESLAWRRWAIETKCQGSAELFSQEYPASPSEAFLSSGSPAFDRRAVLFQERNICPPVEQGYMENGQFVPVRKGWVSVWRRPQDGHQYVVGADTAEGSGGDYACAQVLDMATLEQVALVHGFIQPWDLAHQIAQLAKWYNTALVAVEVQGSGRAVQDYLHRVLHYPNFHVWRGRVDLIRPARARHFGWETNAQSRPVLIEAGRRALNAGLLVLHDRGTLDELMHFSRSDTWKYEAMVGHDDRVLALLIALRSREENYAPAKRALLVPEEHVVPPIGVRHTEAWDSTYQLRRKVRRALEQRAAAGVSSWNHWMAR